MVKQIDIDEISVTYHEDTSRHTYADGTKISYPTITIQDVRIKHAPLAGLFGLFNESNYNAVEMLYIPPEIEELSGELFLAITKIADNNEIVLATALSDYYFGQYTTLWQYYLKHQRHVLGTTLWQHVCRLVWDWEKKSEKKIHKGTLYFFLGATLLRQGNIDLAYLFISNAIEQDKFSSTLMKSPEHYRHLPAYLFSSGIVDNPNNYLYPFVLQMWGFLKPTITSFGTVGYSRSFTSDDFDNKFLKNSQLDSEKLFFLYTINTIINIKNVTTEELEVNDFLKMKRLDILFNLCQVIESALGKKIQKALISKLIQEVCFQKYGVTPDDSHSIYTALDFKKSPVTALETCLSLNFVFNGKPVRKEVLTLIGIWGLRNYGGHNIDTSSPILSTRFDEMVQFVFSGLFIALQEYY